MGKYEERENIKYLRLRFTKCGRFGRLSGDLGVTSRLLPAQNLLYPVVSLKNPQFITGLALATTPHQQLPTTFPAPRQSIEITNHTNPRVRVRHIWPNSLARDPRICNFTKSPSGTEDAFWGTHFENHWYRFWENSVQFHFPHHFLMLRHPLDPWIRLLQTTPVSHNSPAAVSIVVSKKGPQNWGAIFVLPSCNYPYLTQGAISSWTQENKWPNRYLRWDSNSWDRKFNLTVSCCPSTKFQANTTRCYTLSM